MGVPQGTLALLWTFFPKEQQLSQGAAPRSLPNACCCVDFLFVVASEKGGGFDPGLLRSTREEKKALAPKEICVCFREEDGVAGSRIPNRR